MSAATCDGFDALGAQASSSNGAAAAAPAPRKWASTHTVRRIDYWQKINGLSARVPCHHFYYQCRRATLFSRRRRQLLLRLRRHTEAHYNGYCLISNFRSEPHNCSAKSNRLPLPARAPERLVGVGFCCRLVVFRQATSNAGKTLGNTFSAILSGLSTRKRLVALTFQNSFAVRRQ